MTCQHDSRNWGVAFNFHNSFSICPVHAVLTKTGFDSFSSSKDEQGLSKVIVTLIGFIKGGDHRFFQLLFERRASFLSSLSCICVTTTNVGAK